MFSVLHIADNGWRMVQALVQTEIAKVGNSLPIHNASYLSNHDLYILAQPIRECNRKSARHRRKQIFVHFHQPLFFFFLAETLYWETGFRMLLI